MNMRAVACAAYTTATKDKRNNHKTCHDNDIDNGNVTIGMLVIKMAVITEDVSSSTTKSLLALLVLSASSILKAAFRIEGVLCECRLDMVAFYGQLSCTASVYLACLRMLYKRLAPA